MVCPESHMKVYQSGSKAAKKRGFSLVELLAAVSIFSIVMLALSYALEASLGMLNHRSAALSTDGDFRAVSDIFRQDLQEVVVDKPDTHVFGKQVSDSLAQFVDHRNFIPIEIDRIEGTGMAKSFVNGEVGFSALLFAAVSSPARYAHPIREQIRLSSASSGTATIKNQSPDALSEVCLIGYYVAYTRDSSRADSSPSMKLYRHFRSGGINFGDGHANGILAYLADVYNPSSERTAFGFDFSNKSFPFMLSQRYKVPNEWTPEKVTQPWPMNYIASEVTSPPAITTPPKYSSASWLENDHPIHDFVFGDEEIARNVVEFRCAPYKRIETAPGEIELFDTPRLNQRLGLQNTGWPVLVKPDFIDITLGVVGVDAALQMRQKSDWVLPPMDKDLSALSALERIKRQELKRYSIRIPIH